MAHRYAHRVQTTSTFEGGLNQLHVNNLDRYIHVANAADELDAIEEGVTVLRHGVGMTSRTPRNIVAIALCVDVVLPLADVHDVSLFAACVFVTCVGTCEPFATNLTP